MPNKAQTLRRPPVRSWPVRSWRATLLAATSAAALWPAGAMAGCGAIQPDGSIVCSGDLGTGVRRTPPVKKIKVRNVTADLDSGGVNGIALVGGNPTIEADLGGHKITTSASNTVAQGGRAAIGAWGSTVAVGVANASIETTGLYNHGVVAGSYGPSATLTFDGALVTHGSHARGIWVNALSGSATLDARANIRTFGALNADGIKVETRNGLNAKFTGRIETAGENSEGLYLRSTLGTIDALIANSTIATHGLFAGAIEAHAASSVNITASGQFSTDGAGARGIYAASDNGQVHVRADGSITTKGRSSGAIEAYAARHAKVIGTGALTTSGAGSRASSPSRRLSR